MKSTKIVEFPLREAEMIDEEERTAILHELLNFIDVQTEREKSHITEDELKDMWYEELEFTMNVYCELVRGLMEGNDNVPSKFYDFLKRKNNENPYSLDFLKPLYVIDSNSVRKKLQGNM